MDSSKHNKLAELKLDEDEWNWVTNFIDLLSVRISFEVCDCSFNFVTAHLILMNSMPIMHNNHFYLNKHQHFI